MKEEDPEFYFLAYLERQQDRRHKLTHSERTEAKVDDDPSTIKMRQGAVSETSEAKVDDDPAARMKQVLKFFKQKRQRRKNKRTRYRAAEAKLSRKVRDFHYDTAKYLCENYAIILMPNFRASQLLHGGVLRKTTKRRLSILSWGTLIRRLEETSHLYKNCVVLRGSEEYTTKCCGYCFRLNEGVGSSEVFICPFPDCVSHEYFGEEGVPRDDSAAWKIDMKCRLESIHPPGSDVFQKWEYKKRVSLEEARGLLTLLKEGSLGKG